MTNQFKKIVLESAWCGAHLFGRVSRQKDDATRWSVRCSRGWDLYKHPELKLPNEEIDCQITIEGDGYKIH